MGRNAACDWLYEHANMIMYKMLMNGYSRLKKSQLLMWQPQFRAWPLPRMRNRDHNRAL